MKTSIQAVFAAACAMALSGCISFTGQVMPGDDMVDEGNREFAAKADADFQARMKFQRQVVVQEAPGINLFLSPSYVPRSTDARANAICSNLEVRRMIVQSAKAKLREHVQGLRDLKLAGEAQAPMVSVGPANAGASQFYRITYNVSNLDLQRRSYQDFISKQLMNEWTANVSVEIRMISPAGDSVFTFNATGTVSEDQDGSVDPNPSMFETATANAVDKAMKQYAHKFGPPVYVTETCQNGEFAKLNIGQNYGVRPGMKVQFLRHRIKKGFDGEGTFTEEIVGTGTVGQGDAPVDADGSWAHVDGYDAENRTVFQWTSVKLLTKEGSTLGLAIPGLD